MKNRNIVGNKYNRWTILKETNQKNDNGNKLCLAKCECGTEKLVSISNIISSKSKSCGCIAKEKTTLRNITHGASKHPLYHRWNGIRQRCYVPSSSRYKFYGARGVNMCDAWRRSPEAFYDWYESQGGDLKLTVERIDTYGDYTPDNCRLIPQIEQYDNCRTRVDRLSDEVVLTIKDMVKESFPVKEIVVSTGVSKSIIYNIKKGISYK